MGKTGNFLLYTRCSTDEQGKRGNSHEYQTDGVRRSGVVQVGGLQEVGAYSDTVTGTRFDNRGQGLDAAYKLCERQRGRVDFLFVYRWDRLGRSVEDCFAAIRKFKAVGVELNCPDEWVDFSDPSWPLILSVKFGMAQSESMRISDRTKDGVHAAKAAGFWTAHAPVGYTKGPEVQHGGKLRRVCVPDPDKAPIVRTCFERFAAGETKTDLFRKFGQALGIQSSQFYRMLQNPFYCGQVFIQAHRAESARVVDGQHQPIITRQLFETCQQIEANQGHPTQGKTWSNGPAADTSRFYLKGVLKCPDTWRNMTAYRSRGKSGNYFPYYASQRKGVTIPADTAHRIVGQAISGMKISGEHYRDIKNEINRQLGERTTAAMREADTARRGVDRAKSRIENIRADYADGNLSASEYREMKTSFECDLLKHEARLLEAETAQRENEGLFFQVLEMLSGIDTVFAASSPEYKNRILRAVFPEGFTIDKTGGKVRTPCINALVYELCRESVSYAALEIENGADNEARPVMGGEGGRFRTHLEAMKQLFAA